MCIVHGLILQTFRLRDCCRLAHANIIISVETQLCASVAIDSKLQSLNLPASSVHAGSGIEPSTLGHSDKTSIHPVAILVQH